MLKSFVISEQPVGMFPLWRILGLCNGFLRIVEVHNPIHIQEHVGKLLAFVNKKKFILFPTSCNKVVFKREKKGLLAKCCENLVLRNPESFKVWIKK